MTLEVLQNEMIKAMKNGNKFRKNVIAGLVDDVKKAAINKNCRDNITEAMVDEVLLKCKKTAQEQIDTCPAGRIDLLTQYNNQLDIINEFAPTLMTDENEIKNKILNIVNGEVEFTKANRGKIMKTISPVLKGKADMSVVNKVVGDMLT